MNLYLVQHGEAKPETEDPQRPLSDRGRQEVERVARAAARARVALDLEAIYHSGKLRARETAEILSDHLQPFRGEIEMEGLAPRDDPAGAAHAVADAIDANEPLMLVGHLPHLSRLASLLVVGDADREVIAFENGAIVCLSWNPSTTPRSNGPTRERDQGLLSLTGGGGPVRGSAVWRVCWILPPELART